ncbi:MAG: PAS domain-containing sensor histidine kinase, partial [Pedobacter sp.]
MEKTRTYDQLVSRIEELESQVTESHDIIEAIRKGEVDAFIVKSEDQHELYTLKSADKSYRIFFEQMNEGALTINEDNIILYSNSRFASLLNA